MNNKHPQRTKDEHVVHGAHLGDRVKADQLERPRIVDRHARAQIRVRLVRRAIGHQHAQLAGGARLTASGSGGASGSGTRGRSASGGRASCNASTSGASGGGGGADEREPVRCRRRLRKKQEEGCAGRVVTDAENSSEISCVGENESNVLEVDTDVKCMFACVVKTYCNFTEHASERLGKSKGIENRKMKRKSQCVESINRG